ncbi:MAG: hypothetical protein WC249_02065 [Patescibacteria group bacterium]|jgi:hypothetical protein
MIKSIHRYWRRRWEKYYLKSHWHTILDLSLTIIVIFLTAIIIGFYSYRPNVSEIKINYPSPVDLNNPPLELNFSVDNKTIALSDSVQLKINFKNNGLEPVSNVLIDLVSVDQNFILSRINLSTSTPNETLKGQELILNNIAPGRDGEVSLLVNFKAKNSLERLVNWQAQSQYSFNGQVLKQTETLPVLTVTAQLSARNEIYYTSPQGDQLGVGPVPPIVGIPTSYWVFWEAKSSDDFKNLVFSARLPQGVELKSGRSILAGEFNYSSSTRQLIWKVPMLKGQDDSYRLGFEIQIVPSIQQVGQIIDLLSSPQYYATDVLTGQALSGTLAPLTTNLETDRFNSGQGKVINQ